MKIETREVIKECLISVIKNRCLKNGDYEGHKKTIVKLDGKKYPWARVHQCDLFGQSSELYENLDEAVYDFVELMKIYD